MPPPAVPRASLQGLVAATFTPFRSNGAVDVDRIPMVIDHVIAQGASGLYVCGSTGEGPSLTTREREIVAEASVRSARGRVPVVVQVGHNSLEEARGLAAHAQRVGAQAVSATPPGYFKPDSLENLVSCMEQVAAGAPDLPFYYYHIPVLSGVRFDPTELLRVGEQRIPTLRGIKFSDPALHELQPCLEFGAGRHEVLFGVDEMLLGALATGVRGAVGSTYNFAAPLYRRIFAAFDGGDIREARRLQSLSAEMVRVIIGHGGTGGLKEVMALVGVDCGPSRLPRRSCTAGQREILRQRLNDIGFFEWGAVKG